MTWACHRHLLPHPRTVASVRRDLFSLIAWTYGESSRRDVLCYTFAFAPLRPPDDRSPVSRHPHPQPPTQRRKRLGPFARRPITIHRPPPALRQLRLQQLVIGVLR